MLKRAWTLHSLNRYFRVASWIGQLPQCLVDRGGGRDLTWGSRHRGCRCREAALQGVCSLGEAVRGAGGIVGDRCHRWRCPDGWCLGAWCGRCLRWRFDVLFGAWGCTWVLYNKGTEGQSVSRLLQNSFWNIWNDILVNNYWLLITDFYFFIRLSGFQAVREVPFREKSCFYKFLIWFTTVLARYEATTWWHNQWKYVHLISIDCITKLFNIGICFMFILLQLLFHLIL